MNRREAEQLVQAYYDLYDELKPALDALRDAEKAAKQAVLKLGDAVPGAEIRAGYERKRWNSTTLEELAVKHPDILGALAVTWVRPYVALTAKGDTR